METITELINIVNKKRLSKIDVLDKAFLNSKSENLYFKLYNAIANKEIKTDDEAGKLLYNTNKKDPRFKMLKSRLKDKVLNSILLLDVDNTFTNKVGRAYYECIKFNQIIEVLIKINGTTKLVYELVKEDYIKASKYNFYDIQRNYSFYLLNYYALNGNSKAFEKEEANYFKFIQLAQK